MALVYTGSLDDSVARTPWADIRTNDFREVVIRQVLTSEPIGVNDGYIFQSEWAISDLLKGERSLLLELARTGFFKVLCRTKNFDEMPDRMSGIVATHTSLTKRSDYARIKHATSHFGKAILDCNAYASWPEIDIGYGFYALCVAAYRMIGLRHSAAGLGLNDVLRTMTISALHALIQAFEDKPVSIRGRLEGEVIPKIISEFHCNDALAAEFKISLMGLANEFYHVNFAALWAAELLPANGDQTISVETRASPYFRSVMQRGELPFAIDESELNATFQLRMPKTLAEEQIRLLLEFATPGKGAYEAKSRYLRAEERLLSGDEAAAVERRSAIADLDNAIYTVLYGQRDEALVRPVQRTLEFFAEYSEEAVTGTEQLLSWVIGAEFDFGPGAAEGVEVVLRSSAAELPSVVRGVGKLSRARPKLAKSKKRPAALASFGVHKDQCKRFHEATKKVINEFGHRSAIDPVELAAIKREAGPKG
jgi:hypothetical protein